MRKKRTLNAVMAFVMAAAIAVTAAITPPIPVQAAAKKPAKVTVSSVKSTSAGKATVKWKKVSKAKGYQIAYDTNSKFKSKKTKAVSSVKTTSKTLSGLKQGKKYYIRVRAYNKSGKETKYGAWSKTKSVTVKKAGSSKPGKATLSSAKSSDAGKLTVKWKQVSNASGYQIMYAKNSRFTSGKKTKTISGGTKTSATLTGLTKGKKYYVRVRAYQKSGKTKKYGSWSSTKKATVAAKKAATTKYEKYDNGLISMDIPKGWKVNVATPSVEYIGYGFKLYNPRDPRYGLEFYLSKGIGYDSVFYVDNKEAMDWTNKFAFGGKKLDYVLVNPMTPEGYFRGVIEYKKGKLNVTQKLYTESVPNVGTIETFRAIITDKNGNSEEGIFSAEVIPGVGYPQYELLGSNRYLGLLHYLTIYGPTVITAPVGKLNTWTDTLIHCLETVTYSDKFKDGYDDQWRDIGVASQNIWQNNEKINNAIMKGWEERMK